MKIILSNSALGMTVEMRPGVGPVFPSPLQTPDDIDKLQQNPNDAVLKLQYVYDAINLTRHQVNDFNIDHVDLVQNFLN